MLPPCWGPERTVCLPILLTFRRTPHNGPPISLQASSFARMHTQERFHRRCRHLGRAKRKQCLKDAGNGYGAVGGIIVCAHPRCRYSISVREAQAFLRRCSALRRDICRVCFRCCLVPLLRNGFGSAARPGQGRAASFAFRPRRLSTPAIADLSLGSAVSLPSFLFMGPPSGERSRLPQTQNQRGRGAAFRALLGGSFVWSHAAKQLVDGRAQTHVAKPAVRRHSLQGVVEFFFAQACDVHAPEACRRSGAPSASQL